ncbi:putative 40S ribosomal protein S15 [Iris pallida]|uniref:Ubiquinol oxidase n=1 Tax=Iris pallida TaxID=29817 RepID=A0AAX6DZ67_IRIPA|nr:putative 40S ribosomal protein S15 [Iris pallida]
MEQILGANVAELRDLLWVSEKNPYRLSRRSSQANHCKLSSSRSLTKEILRMSQPQPLPLITYWRLLQNATLCDVVMVVRAEEAHHHNVNHFNSDSHCQGNEMKELPSLVGYH